MRSEEQVKELLDDAKSKSDSFRSLYRKSKTSDNFILWIYWRSRVSALAMVLQDGD